MKKTDTLEGKIVESTKRVNGYEYKTIDIRESMKSEMDNQYGKYDDRGDQTMEQYAMAQIEQVKHLQPKFTEHELVNKLSYRFNRNI